MEIVLSSLLIFLLLVEADKTDRLQSDLAKLKYEMNYKFNTSDRVHNLQEKRIQQLFDKLSGQNYRNYFLLYFK